MPYTLPQTFAWPGDRVDPPAAPGYVSHSFTSNGGTFFGPTVAFDNGFYVVVSLCTEPGVENLGCSNMAIVPIPMMWGNSNYYSGWTVVQGNPIFADLPNVDTLVVGANVTSFATGMDSSPYPLPPLLPAYPEPIPQDYGINPSGFDVVGICIGQFAGGKCVASSGLMYPSAHKFLTGLEANLPPWNDVVAGLGKAPLIVAGQPATDPWTQYPQRVDATMTLPLVYDFNIAGPPSPLWLGSYNSYAYWKESGISTCAMQSTAMGVFQFIYIGPGAQPGPDPAPLVPWTFPGLTGVQIASYFSPFGGPYLSSVSGDWPGCPSYCFHEVKMSGASYKLYLSGVA